jgi:hypothetical protein
MHATSDERRETLVAGLATTPALERRGDSSQRTFRCIAILALAARAKTDHDPLRDLSETTNIRLTEQRRFICR